MRTVILSIVLLVLTSCGGEKEQSRDWNAPDPNYNSFDEIDSRSWYDDGGGSRSNSRAGQARERNRRRHNDEFYGR